MVIDIINYTDEQLAALNEEQILEVKAAQKKKNTLAKKLAKAKQAFRIKLVENGTFLSETWRLGCEELDSEYEADVTAIREELLFYLRFVNKVNSTKYPVDYSLPMETRFYNVRDYYETTYPDLEQRYAAFKEDDVAKVYLGEYYAVLHDYFLTDII